MSTVAEDDPTHPAATATTHARATERFRALRERLRDPALSALLLVQGLVLFVLIPGGAAGFPLPSALPAGVMLALMSCVIFLAHGTWTRTAGIVLPTAALTTGLARRTFPGVEADIASALVTLATYGTLSVIVMAAVFAPGRVTSHRIRGAVVFYLNVGLMFGLLDRIVLDLAPGAFTSLPVTDDRRVINAALNYFSLSTLTSVGYGDIAPVHPMARALCNLESVIGQLFPATLLARIVSLELDARRK